MSTVSYKKLFKLLIDKEMKKSELVKKAHISSSTLTKMRKENAVIRSDALERICVALGCTLNDIMEIKGDNNNEKIN